MSLSIVPYLLFLYFVWRIYKLDKNLLTRTTLLGFASMLGFVFVTAISGFVALRIMGATTLAHVDWLHGVAEAGLTLTNGLIALGLKSQLDRLDLEDGEAEAEDESNTPVLAGSATGQRRL